MIARLWHGWTNKWDFEEYSIFLKTVAIPDYENTTGFKGLVFLRRIIGSHAHFKLITYWDNFDVIQNFAGRDIESAKYYPEDNNFLLEFGEKVEHYEVFAHN